MHFSYFEFFRLWYYAYNCLQVTYSHSAPTDLANWGPSGSDWTNKIFGTGPNKKAHIIQAQFVHISCTFCKHVWGFHEFARSFLRNISIAHWQNKQKSLVIENRVLVHNPLSLAVHLGQWKMIQNTSAFGR